MRRGYVLLAERGGGGNHSDKLFSGSKISQDVQNCFFFTFSTTITKSSKEGERDKFEDAV